MKNWLRILLICSLLLMTTAMTYARRYSEGDIVNGTATPEAAALKCAKCQSPMEDGFMLDQQGPNADYTNSRWVPGPVRKKFVGGLETKGKRPILAFRCTSCGYLELYAK